ncbi:NAD(P)H-binding protein [Psychromarinibacter sp. C21-152]|uniref:NAD(P)H-binding protein n=1 Tax=Psychromarinibacter sediminicola TaxID=3033385 RepID=A0AAE3TB45_9RHOB|nr:NAD-dependent epimerase/dehydratase family protein [Psychromarinibacter sediminicola]MDF0603922.1 NAD(P)H-binding protein [Psychromarinibacter sediminicola]
MHRTDQKTALILGATGGVGSETARALAAHGWRIRALARDPKKAPALDAEWVRGDAMTRQDVVAAAEGCQLIFHGVNPPGYRDWDKLAVPMLENTIAAARAAGARVVFPGTVYNYGPDAFPVLREDSPQSPTTRKGAVRVEMERRLERASHDGVPVLILRAGDFFGPYLTANSWFSQALVKPGRPLTRVTYPGAREVGHAWAYLPDFGETIARLMDREAELGVFERFHMEGHWFERGVEIAERLRPVAGVPDAPIRRMPWLALDALSPVVTTFRELREMRYLWRTPVKLDGAKLRGFLGDDLPHTPADLALRRSLEGQGCLPQSDAGLAPAAA